MIKTIKRKIRPWKMLVIAGVIPVAFFVIACQDQLTNEVAEIAQTSTMAVDIPAEVQQKYDELLKANPRKMFLLMETDENMTPKLEEMKKEYDKLHQEQISRIELITPTVKENEGLRTFVIIEYDEDLERARSRSKVSEKIFSMVEDTATPEGGMGAFYEHVGRKLKYPVQARRMGIEGKVFVQFVVTEDGSITDATIVKGIGGGCDKEALMVVQTSPIKWSPGKIKGVAVKQYMVLPISFKLDKGQPITSKDVTIAPKNALSEVVAVAYSE